MRSLFLWLGVMLLWLTTSVAVAQAPPDEPELRIEAGMHRSIIRRVAVSSDGKRMVSASYDKTIRVWSLPDGKLENVLRVPIGEGFEGSIFAIALSPDGKTIAAGGWMKQQFIYLIDVTSGQIIRSLGPHADVTMNLAFSPDGGKLVAVFARTHGMRMYDVATGTLFAEDTNYSADTNALAFSENGSLFATGSYDGLLRLYRQDGSLVTQVNAPSSKRLFSIAFAPGDEKLAIGYGDAPKVDIFRTTDYQWQPQPDLSGVENGDFSAVAWSKDGSSLFAGGTFRDETGWYRVVCWPDQGKGKREYIYSFADTILDLQPYGQDGVVAGGALPQIVVIERKQSPDTGRTWEPLAEWFTPNPGMGKGSKAVLTINEKGTQVRFSLDVGGGQPVLFDAETLALKDVIDVPDHLIIPDTTSLKLENWYNSSEAKANGKILAVDPDEKTLSVSVAPDRRTIAVGTNWYVRNYSAAGEFRWRTSIPGYAWGINFTQASNLIIAAVGDGTIRWFRADDGKELLALFVHNKDKRWILWTPEGYYAASPGGENLIGWHLNRGDAMAPDFFPASRLRETYSRPDIVQKVLEVLDVDVAIRLANAGREDGTEDKGKLSAASLPPVIDLVMDSNEIKTATSLVQVSYRVRSPSGEPVEGIDVLINGRPLEGRAAIAIPNEEEVTTLDIPIPSQDVEIGLVARTKSGASEVKIVKVLWDGAFAEMLKPKLYAVVVGVSNYENTDYKLKYAAQDAVDFATALKRQEGGMYGKVDVRLITDADATRDDIVEALEWLEGEVTSRDVGIVFMAGHGVTDTKQRFYYLPVDGDLQKLRSSAVSRDDLLATMSGLAGKAMMFIDACHSAASLDGEQKRGVAAADITQIVNELSSAENGVVMFASSTGRQVSVENDVWKNGAFTEALLEGFSGGADYVKDGKLTIAELDLWLSDRVKQLTNKRQAPVVRKPDTVPDFPIALVR